MSAPVQWSFENPVTPFAGAPSCEPYDTPATNANDIITMSPTPSAFKPPAPSASAPPLRSAGEAPPPALTLSRDTDTTETSMESAMIVARVFTRAFA